MGRKLKAWYFCSSQKQHDPLAFFTAIHCKSTQSKSVFSYCDKNKISLKREKLRDPHPWSLGLVHFGPVQHKHRVERVW